MIWANITEKIYFHSHIYIVYHSSFFTFSKICIILPQFHTLNICGIINKVTQYLKQLIKKQRRLRAIAPECDVSVICQSSLDVVESGNAWVTTQPPSSDPNIDQIRYDKNIKIKITFNSTVMKIVILAPFCYWIELEKFVLVKYGKNKVSLAFFYRQEKTLYLKFVF